MVKVSSKIGLTLKLFKESQYEFIRPEISLEIEVDKEEDIEKELSLAEKAVKMAWEKNSELIDEMVIAELPNVSEEMQIQVSKRLNNFEKQLEDLRKSIARK